MRIYIKNIKTLLIFLGVSVVNITIHSQSLPDSTIKKIDSLFKKWDNNNSPGCALGIVKDGQLIYKHGYGMANLDHSIPISPKSVFDIGSISKQFTAMSILLLAKQGKLSLDNEIQKYLPEVPRYQSPITIRHLIHHTSGIRNYIELLELAGMRGENVHLTDDDLLGLIALQKELNFKPGEEYVYSNSGFFLTNDNRPPSILTRGEEYVYSSSGYFLLGLIVKRVSGMSLRQFAEENIFKQLGMNNTHFHDDRNLVVRNRVTAYLPNSNGGFAAAIPIDDPPGDGGLFTSVEDLFLWDQNFYNNKLGSGPDLISEALSTGKLNNGKNTGYAFGLQVRKYKGLKTIGHGGSGGGFRSAMNRFPELNFSVMCLCNEWSSINPDGLANQVADIFLVDQLNKGTAVVNETVSDTTDIFSIPEKELASLTRLYVDLTGLHVDPIKVHSHRIYLKDGKLMVYSYVLLPLSRNRFNTVGALQPHEFLFIQPVAGGPMQVKEKQIRSGIITTIDEVQRETLTSVQLAEFTGKYVSDELAGATYALSIKDGKLSLQVRNGITVFSDRGLGLAFTQPSVDTTTTPIYVNNSLVLAFAQPSVSKVPKDILLTSVFADAFITFVSDELVMLRFMRNQQNAVSGFTLSSGTVRKLRFNKL